MTVQGQGYGNAFHDPYGEDGLGHVWVGGGGNAVGEQMLRASYGVPLVQQYVQQRSASTYQFLRARGSRCSPGELPRGRHRQLQLVATWR